MTFPAGTRLGPYEVLSTVGKGGMGEVHRVRDTRLDRIVAIKTLSPSLAADPAFRERFEREARTLSGLSHPNVCAVYDIGREGTTEYLVMEFVEGRTLADVLERGPLPVAEALRIARQIADALIAAHRLGIVHRDLKPANVMIAGAGTSSTAKLLDFGLAKRAAAVPGTMSGGNAPTRAAPLTGVGAILGTIHYMAPEQIEGHEADARADVWAFGCVLYEMLTGRRAFDAPTHASVIAAILDRQPDTIQLPDARLSPAINRLVAACLEKNPDDRFQSMRDVRRELDWLDDRTAIAATARRAPRWPFAVAAAAVAVAAVAAFVAFSQAPSASHGGAAAATAFTIPLGSTIKAGSKAFFGGAGSGTPHVAPDGRRIAFLAHDAADARIYLRDLGSLEIQPLRGTTGARGLFWSPDGRSIGFFANGKLQTLELASGRVDVVCDAPLAFGGSWAADGTILFSPDERTPLFKVDGRGGSPVAVTSLKAGEQAHRWPQFLPDGRHFIYMPWSDSTTTRHAMAASLDGGEARSLFTAQSAAVSTGDFLMYVSDLPSRLMARRFDARSLTLQGQPFPIVGDDNVDYQWYTGEPNVSAAGETLAYTTGKYRRTQLTWVSRTGRRLGTIGDPGIAFDPTLSPDGTLLALERNDPGRGTGDIWTLDLARGAFSRLTSAPGYETTPAWTPDGRVAYASDQGEKPGLYVTTASGSGGPSLLVVPAQRGFPLDWSHDGRYLLYLVNAGPEKKLDVWMYDTQTRRESPLLASDFNESAARVSPDGRWIAYITDESNLPEVYVRSFPDLALKVRISTNGGNQPQWRGDGKELFYIAPDNTVYSVPITAAGSRVVPGTPEPLFTANVDQNKSIRNQFAVTRDGQRFLLLSLVDRDASPFVAVLGWRSLARD
ncbi:MAG TPA: protein kinase [Vicinamibacterales bacterium]|nr:protein kinase [Vicinamibacterales bacterium]